MLIHIVTFNRNEADAVDTFLDELTFGTTSWSRKGPDAIITTNDVLRHIRLNAQGNVIAATSLASAYSGKQPPDFYIFYGCAGALQPSHANSVFLVDAAMYLSLGTVSPHPSMDDGEVVTLKNKWLCQHKPPDVQPIKPIEFPMMMSVNSPAAVGQPSETLSDRTGIPTAHVAATDKVIKVSPGSSPTPLFSSFGVNTYQKDEWTYRNALAFVEDLVGDKPVIVEMESFGIASVAKGLKVDDRVVILRVTTDALVDHATSDDNQRKLLMKSRHALGLVVLGLLEPYHPHLATWRANEN